MQAQDFPPHAAETMMRLVSLYGRLGAGRIYKVPFNSTVAPGATTTGTSIKWRKPGIVVAMYGTTLGATAAEAAGLEVRLQFGGQEELITDGDSGVFVAFRALFGDAQNWFPLDRAVRNGEEWTALFRNRTVGGIDPSLCFALIEAR